MCGEYAAVCGGWAADVLQYAAAAVCGGYAAHVLQYAADAMRKANVAVRFDTAGACRGRIVSSPHSGIHGALPFRKTCPPSGAKVEPKSSRKHSQGTLKSTRNSKKTVLNKEPQIDTDSL